MIYTSKHLAKSSGHRKSLATQEHTGMRQIDPKLCIFTRYCKLSADMGRSSGHRGRPAIPGSIHTTQSALQLCIYPGGDIAFLHKDWSCVHTGFHAIQKGRHRQVGVQKACIGPHASIALPHTGLLVQHLQKGPCQPSRQSHTAHWSTMLHVPPLSQFTLSQRLLRRTLWSQVEPFHPWVH